MSEIKMYSKAALSNVPSLLKQDEVLMALELLTAYRPMEEVDKMLDWDYKINNKISQRKYMYAAKCINVLKRDITKYNWPIQEMIDDGKINEAYNLMTQLDVENTYNWNKQIQHLIDTRHLDNSQLDTALELIGLLKLDKKDFTGIPITKSDEDDDKNKLMRLILDLQKEIKAIKEDKSTE
jgi:hypothetical protein